MGKNNIFHKAALGAAGAVSLNGGIGLTGPEDAMAARADIGEIVLEKPQQGKPHRGKVFAAVHAHLDDIPYYAAGTCAKLIEEGYTGYLIRTSNDEKCGGNSTAMNIYTNEQENLKMAKAVGFEDVFDLYYRNHRMNEISLQEMRFRMMFLFRMLKVDTVVSFNPWGHGEENPDHWVTGRVVEECCWMSAMGNDYPEQLLAPDIETHGVRERYYFVGRPGQPYNRVVDISNQIEKKIDALSECKSQGGGNRGSLLRQRLAKQGKKLPLLGSDDRTADREYIRQFMLDPYRELGEEYGVEYAERFYYIDQRPGAEQSGVDKYIEENAVDL